MTREEFNKLPSTGRVLCPDCGEISTHPYPGCHCRGMTVSKEYPCGIHINLYHHTCKKDKSKDV